MEESRYVDENAFYKDLPAFEEEYRRSIELHVSAGTYRDGYTWKVVRDEVLHDFPLLDYCYREHGWWHDEEYDRQPLAAKLGRRIAGIMWNACQELVPSCDEHEYSQVQEKIMNKYLEGEDVPVEDTRYAHVKPAGARWVTRSQVMVLPEESEPKPRSENSKILAKSIEHVNKGEYVWLGYTTKSDAQRDRSLMHDAEIIAGWLEGLDTDRYRIYSTELVETPDHERPWKLKVIHLRKEVVRSKRSRKRLT